MQNRMCLGAMKAAVSQCEFQMCLKSLQLPQIWVSTTHGTGSSERDTLVIYKSGFLLASFSCRCIIPSTAADVKRKKWKLIENIESLKVLEQIFFHRLVFSDIDYCELHSLRLGESSETSIHSLDSGRSSAMGLKTLVASLYNTALVSMTLMANSKLV